MKTSLCKVGARADAISASSNYAVNQSHREVDQNNGNVPITTNSVSNQSSRRSWDPRLSRDPRHAASQHTQPLQQQTSMIQPAVSPSKRVNILKITIDPRDGHPLLLSHWLEQNSHDPATQPNPAMISLPSGLPLHTFMVATDASDGNYVILSHTVEVTGRAPNSVVDPSNSTEGQPSGSDVEAREAHDDNQTMVQMMFKTALIEFVTKQIEETRDQGQSSMILLCRRLCGQYYAVRKKHPQHRRGDWRVLEPLHAKNKQTYTGILSQVQGKISSVKFVESKKNNMGA